MAPLSPRRSSRARAPNSQSHQSSVSSSTSGRIERSTRLLHKPSSGKSTPSASLSSEPLEDFDDTLLGRRRKRGQDDDLDRPPQLDSIEMAIASEDMQDDEDEAVRCLCGSEEYPGRPPLDGPDAEIFATVDLTEDVTGFFVQCDICKVWQHGACVGIFSAESSPDEYFCEQCRKDLHKIHIASNGQKYSKYLPLYQTSRATSLATSIVKEDARSPKVGATTRSNRPNSASLSSKRRSTMNSRDAAYDDELLRRVIEASKEDVVQETVENHTRRAKRGRSDSEENLSSVKRQRTSSRSVSPPVEQLEDQSRDDSEDEMGPRSASKKLRAGKPQPEKTEKEERELQRQEAANKRKGRAERRRAEDSDPSDDMPLAASKAAAKASVEPPNAIEASDAAQITPGTPPPIPPAVGSSHKRGARSNHKKSKGKNQYTKDRDADIDESPARSMSRDIQKNMDDPVAAGPSKLAAADHKTTSKSRPTAPGKMSMLDMKRRVAAIMDFISRTQVDLAAEAEPNLDGEDDSPQTTAPGGSPERLAQIGVPNGLAGDASQDKDFKELNCVEMMDILTRDMVKWQNQYA